MRIRSILLLEPFNTPLDILTKNHMDFRTNKKKALIAFAAGLIYKKYRIRVSSVHSIPLGLAQLSSIVKSEGVDTEHIPFLLDSSKRYLPDDEIEREINSYDYDSVWMTIGSPESAYETLRYARIIKRINKDAPIMIGGVLPSMYPEFFLKNEDINFLIRGPSEIAVKQYIRDPTCENFSKIQGFCYRLKSGEINVSPNFAITPDLTKIPQFDLEGLCIDAYMKDNHFSNLQTSRGCPFNCPFCTHVKFWGKKLQFRPINHLRKEMKILQEHGCKAGYIIDSTFTLNKDHVRKFVETYKEEGISIRFGFETRADQFSDKMASLTARINPLFVCFGAESGSPTVLKHLRGKSQGNGLQHINNLFNGLANAKKYGILCGSTWVIGLPGENKDTIEETKKVIFDLSEAGMDIVDIRILQIFPGTDYYVNPKKWGIKLNKIEISEEQAPWDKVASHETEELSSEEIAKAAKDLTEELVRYYFSTSSGKK